MTDLTGADLLAEIAEVARGMGWKVWTEYGYVHYRHLDAGTKYAVNLAFDDNMVIRVLKLLRHYGPEEAVNQVLDKHTFVDPTTGEVINLRERLDSQRERARAYADEYRGKFPATQAGLAALRAELAGRQADTSQSKPHR